MTSLNLGLKVLVVGPNELESGIPTLRYSVEAYPLPDDFTQPHYDAWRNNRPCAQQYVGKSQSCMVSKLRII